MSNALRPRALKSSSTSSSRLPAAFSSTRPPRASSSSGTGTVAQQHALCAHAYQELRMRLIRAKSAAADPSTTLTSEPVAPAAAPAGPSISALNIRVGRIVKVERHPDAESLYVEQVDVGEAEPRTIVSGLVKFVPIEQMQDRSIVVLCNLKARNMRGVKSHGMVLCASDAAHENVELLVPAEGAAPGERVWFGEGNQTQPAPEEPNRIDKKKIWEALQPFLKTDGAKVAGFKGLPMMTSQGAVTAASLANASIS